MVRAANVLRLRMGVGLAGSLVCMLGACVGELPADTITLLPGDAAAAEARFQVVLSAECRLDVAYFTIDGDAVSCCFLELLVDAARRGVRVRIVVDGMHNGIPADIQMALFRCGARIKEYHRPEVPQVQSFTRRLHDKLLLKDGTEMIVGSRNIEDAHFGLRELDSENYLDLDVHVSGQVVAEACEYFDGLWTSCELQEVDSDRLHRRMRQEQQAAAARRLLAGIPRAWRPSDQGIIPAACGEPIPGGSSPQAGCCGCCPESISLEIDCGGLCFFCDRWGRKCQGGARESVYGVLESARHWIVLETPYFVPSDELGRILKDALARGVRVLILTNSWQTTDYPVIYAGYRNVIGQYVRMGAEVWEYAGPRTLHAKSLVVDGCVACVSSFNFDPRSAHLDTQVGVVACDPQVAECLLGILDGHFAQALPISIAGQPRTDRDGPMAAARGGPVFAGFGIAGAARLSLLRVLAPIVWNQL